jgi:membrane protein YdbS with pleckstrin-like domain
MSDTTVMRLIGAFWLLLSLLSMAAGALLAPANNSLAGGAAGFFIGLFAIFPLTAIPIFAYFLARFVWFVLTGRSLGARGPGDE